MTRPCTCFLSAGARTSNKARGPDAGTSAEFTADHSRLQGLITGRLEPTFLPDADDVYHESCARLYLVCNGLSRFAGLQQGG